jgi:hypothetical protein
VRSTPTNVVIQSNKSDNSCSDAVTVNPASASAPSGPPSTRITSPATGGTYVLGDTASTSFLCTEAPTGPGLASCTDSNRQTAPTGRLKTTSLGSHTYTVTATSKDGQSAAATITYTVVAPPTITIRSTRASVTGGRASIILACRGLAGRTCRGSVSLTMRITQKVPRRIHGHRRIVTVTKTIVLARASYLLATNNQHQVAIRLSHGGVQMLDRAPKQRLHVQANVTSPPGASATRSIVLQQQPPPKHH